MTADQGTEPRYTVRMAAELVCVHPQTLRMYERSGLICPGRGQGRVRLYSEADLLRIRRIQSYTALGVNLAGIEIIFRLLERVETLEASLREAEAGRQAEDEWEQTEHLRRRLRREGNYP